MDGWPIAGGWARRGGAHGAGLAGGDGVVGWMDPRQLRRGASSWGRVGGGWPHTERKARGRGAAGGGGAEESQTGTHLYIYTLLDTFGIFRKKHCGCTHVGDTFAGMDFSLANLGHLELFFLILLYEGSLCPKCGHGTRVLSKGWAKCKECGG